MMMYTARHRRAPIRRAWNRLDRPMTWVELAGAAAAAGVMTALFTMIVLCG